MKEMKGTKKITPAPKFGNGKTASLPEQLANGKYTNISRFNDSGGMGIICRATQTGNLPEMDRPVAIKLLRNPGSDRARKRFLEEIRIASELDIDGVVRIYDFGEDQGWLYYVMPLLENCRNLERFVLEENLDAAEILEVVARAATVIDRLHTYTHKEIIHRDLKPENILVDRNGKITILDLGIAVALTGGNTDRTWKTIGVVGTPAFLSPEQAAGTPASELTPGVDIYALGVIVYRLLARDFPHKSTDSRLALLVNAIVHDPPRPLKDHRPDLPRQIHRIIMHALEKKPGRRYRTAGEFAEKLAEASTFLSSNIGGKANESSAMNKLARGLLLTLAALLVLAGVAYAVPLLLRQQNSGEDTLSQEAPRSGREQLDALTPAPAASRDTGPSTPLKQQSRTETPDQSQESEAIPGESASSENDQQDRTILENQKKPPASSRKIKLLLGEVPKSFAGEYRQYEKENSANPTLKALGTLIYQLSPESSLVILQDDFTIHSANARLSPTGAFRRKPGEPVTVKFNLPDAETQSWTWTPKAGQIDCLVSSPE